MVVIVPLMMLSFPSVCSMFTFMFTADCYDGGYFPGLHGGMADSEISFRLCTGNCASGPQSGAVSGLAVRGAGRSGLRPVSGLCCGRRTGSARPAAGIPAARARSVFLRGVKTFVVLLASVALYSFIARRIFPELDSYNNRYTYRARLPRLILRAYRWVAEYFILKPWSFVNGFSWALNVISCLLVAGGVIAWFVKKRLWKQPAAALLYLFLAAAIPLAMGSIIIMAPDASVSIYQYVILYIHHGHAGTEPAEGRRPVFGQGRREYSRRRRAGGARWRGAAGKGDACGRRYTPEGGKSRFRRLPGILSLFVTVVLLLVGYENFVVTNEAYFGWISPMSAPMLTTIGLWSGSRSTEGYHAGDAFALVGEYGLSEPADLLGSYPMDGERFEDLSGVARETGLLTSGVRHNFMKIYIGVKCGCERGNPGGHPQTEEYQSMPSYLRRAVCRKFWMCGW